MPIDLFFSFSFLLSLLLMVHTAVISLSSFIFGQMEADQIQDLTRSVPFSSKRLMGI